MCLNAYLATKSNNNLIDVLNWLLNYIVKFVLDTA